MTASLFRSFLRPCGLALLLLPATHSVRAEQSAARIWNEQLLAAIRLNVPNPPGHARNLFHTAVAMYDAWAAYDATATGYIYNEKVLPLPADVEAARREAISCAAYRLLKIRFSTAPQGPPADRIPIIQAALDSQLSAMGFNQATVQSAVTAGQTPTELGKRVAQAILNWGAGDGFGLQEYPQAYTAAVNPNKDRLLSVLGTIEGFTGQFPLGHGIPDGTDPNLWQPLDLDTVTQNGIRLLQGPQTFTGVQGLAVTPFSLTRTDPLKPWLDPFGGPSRLSTTGQPSLTDVSYKANAMDVLRKSAHLNDEAVEDFSPATTGNNSLGADDGTGRAENPVAHTPFPPNPAKRGDFFRVLAEFWADGPNSETPPGHWHVLANEISELPALEKRIRGSGPVLNSLEWDVKVYFALAAATHDAACAAWSLKRYYSGTRPITMIRYMGSKGQSSDPLAPSYHSEGLPLENGVAELITTASSSAGGKHAVIWDVANNGNRPGSSLRGQVAVFSWPGEHPDNPPAPSVAIHQSLVRWQLAKDWLPFQRKTFNTPPFPGYISGHSTFSRAAAETLTILTGSPYLPGGFHHHTVAANTMQIDKGPSAPVDLQWCTYYDAADQAGVSRRWGGIHPYEDDFHGRHIGSVVGKSACTLAEKYWTGAILGEIPVPAITLLPGGNLKLTWTTVRGMRYKVQTTADFLTWTDAAPAAVSYTNAALATDSSGSWIDTSPVPGRKFYRIVRTNAPQ